MRKAARLLAPSIGLTGIQRKVLTLRLEGKSETETCQRIGISRSRYYEAIRGIADVLQLECSQIDQAISELQESVQAEVLEEFASVAYRRK